MAEKKVSLTYLLLTFLKIGASSWGGFMALISVIQKQLVDRDKVLKDEEILDSISLASVLPGPMAFNVVSHLGYHLRGMKGALISMFAILLPSFILILGLTFFYFKYDEVPGLESFFLGILPAVSAIIISVAYSMARKHLKDYKQIILCIIAGLLLIFLQTFFATLIIMVLGAIFGAVFYRKQTSSSESVKVIFNYRHLFLFFGAIVFGAVVLFILPILFPSIEPIVKIQRKLIATFSGMSLTLFGGGYVIIPTIQTVIVENLQWLTNREFTDAIAMGQITPGPIFISATFIGYKVAGLLGAFTATIAIFVPPGLLMIFCSRFIQQIKSSNIIAAIFKGIRPVVIGMIFTAAFTIGKGISISWPSLLIFTAVLVLSLRFKVNVVYLIPASGILGLLLF